MLEVQCHYRYWEMLWNSKVGTVSNYIKLLKNQDLNFCFVFLAILQRFSELFQEHGKLVKVFLAFKPILLVADYKAMEAVLGSNKVLNKSTFYDFLHNWLGFGLLTSSGSKWKQRRRILTPAYHFQILEQFVPIFSRVSDILINEFKKETRKDAVDVYPYITLSTLDVICGMFI